MREKGRQTVLAEEAQGEHQEYRMDTIMRVWAKRVDICGVQAARTGAKYGLRQHPGRGEHWCERSI